MIKLFIQIILVFGCCMLLIIFSEGASNGAGIGLKYCGELLIPSLFPFMVISSYIVNSGLSLKLSRAFSPFMKAVFCLPGSTAPTVIMSFIGGFPVGARGIAEMYKSGLISENQAKRMSLFCIGAGPAFLITAVGTVLLKNALLGVIVLISQIISGLTLGVISRFFYRDKESNISVSESKKFSSKGAFVKSCSDGASGIISLGALVILFQAFIGVMEQSGLSEIINRFLYQLGLGRFSEVLLPSILEVTGACSKIIENGLPIWFLSAAVGFGGICVYLQIWGILSEIDINKPLFILFRLLNSIISGAVTYIITLLYNPVNDVFSSFSEKPLPDMASHIAGSIALLMLSAVFLLSLSVKKKSKIIQK